ncbi:MAG: hypothetical protein DI624_06470 [Brevundimonas sp.]|uniref:hypothetical protein n=1 Tax=Brevundimonas sp. TaxID=1871086 RepID=UPI000DB5CFDB|nr:hypothetical protein [Brevundimonas sp.]PZT98997.1 MAG: hypothetical protein DI624_06470 [Brevundimonas sp.]
MADGSACPGFAPVERVLTGDAASRRLTDRAVRLFLDALPHRVKFPEAARALGVTARDLEAAFGRQALHPRHHLRKARLAQLHADLRAARHPTVAQALMRWGFPSASEDALRDYLTRYRCTPQATLDEARRVVSGLPGSQKS